jgi:cell pole-organizing protein PopZ
MRKSDQTLEPSIEEILASIRKIIADDGSQVRENAAEPFAGGAEQPHQPRPASLPRFLDPHAYEPAEPAEPAGEDEIMELTEDIILDDRSSQDNRDSGEFEDQTADPFATAAIGGEVDPDAERHSVNAQLENVFSSVAAEVERLSHGQTSMTEPEAASAETDDWDGPNQVRQAVETYNAAVSSRTQSRAPEEARPGKSSAPTPTPEGRHEPADPAPRPVASPLTSRPQSRQVWSARHLEGEGPRSRRGKDEDESPAVSQRGEPPARATMSGARDSWAEGVQMPVPDSGPTVPFASAPDDDLIPETVAPKTASSPAADIEKEKDYVGGVLTRVFGRSQKKGDEAPPPAAPAPASKAEKLAKATISDFAAEKLRAPVVADALQADKPFMEAITDSLETALANVEMDAPNLAEPTESPKDTSMMEAQPAPYDELLPDALLPFDSELAPFAAGQIPGSSTQEKAPAPRGKAPEFPIESARGPGMPKSGLFRADNEAPLGAALSGQPAPATEPARPQSALPSGLEDSIKELIKPLIIEWLNNNLPRIVEKAIREELADHGGLGGLRREGGVRR